MKTTKIVTLIALLALVLALVAGCKSSPAPSAVTPAATPTPAAATPEIAADDDPTEPEVVTITGIVDLVPHSELIEFVIPKLAARGINVVLVSTAADATTNEKTATGEIDFNFHQHLPYLESWNETNGFNLVSVGDIHVEPITAYSDRYSAVEELPESVVVAIPNDGTNEYRALLILEQNGFITLDESTLTSLSASVTDIKEYLRDIEIIELDSTQIIPTKADFDFFITNTNKALEAKITSAKLFSEGADSPYANIIVVDESQQNNPAVLELVKELQSEETRQFILDTYNGAVIPAKVN